MAYDRHAQRDWYPVEVLRAWSQAGYSVLDIVKGVCDRTRYSEARVRELALGVFAAIETPPAARQAVLAAIDDAVIERRLAALPPGPQSLP